MRRRVPSAAITRLTPVMAVFRATFRPGGVGSVKVGSRRGWRCVLRGHGPALSHRHVENRRGSRMTQPDGPAVDPLDHRIPTAPAAPEGVAALPSSGRKPPPREDVPADADGHKSTIGSSRQEASDQDCLTVLGAPLVPWGHRRCSLLHAIDISSRRAGLNSGPPSPIGGRSGQRPAGDIGGTTSSAAGGDGLA